MFFVVRKDVTFGDGQQVVFDAKPTKDEAFDRRDYYSQNLKGDFAVFEGEEVERD